MPKSGSRTQFRGRGETMVDLRFELSHGDQDSLLSSVLLVILTKRQILREVSEYGRHICGWRAQPVALQR